MKCVAALFIDFDKTISKDHVYYSTGGSSDEKKITQKLAQEFMGGEQRIALLHKKFQSYTDRKIEMYIVSYGFIGIIKRVLKFTGLLSFFKNRIYGRDSSLLKRFGYDKGKFIQYFKTENNWKSYQVLFIDDDLRNTALINEKRTARVYTITSGKGLTKDSFDAVEQLLKYDSREGQE